MRNATGSIQSALVLGGNSDLALAVVGELVGDRVRRVVLAARDIESAEVHAEGFRARGAAVDVAAYDALDSGAHRRVLDAATASGDIDAIFVAFGVLGEPFDMAAEADTTAHLGAINFTAAVAATQAAADVLKAQGHGSLVVFSSVAGTRVRAENAVYGASKAGLDGFALALADALHDTGVHVMVVRPGFVHTKMTEGREPAPFATTPDRVAADVIAGLRKQQRVVWSPAILRVVATAMRVLPGPLWRRIAS